MKILCTTILLALLSAGAAMAQSGTSSLAGRVTDSSGLAIPGVTVAVTDEASGESRQMATNDLGDFVFAGLFPGTYTVKVQAQGFRVLERKGNVLISSTRLSVGTLQLEVGSVTESLIVTAQGAQVQTDSSEKSELVDLKELQNIAIRGRDPVSFLNLLPGTQQLPEPDFLGGSFGTTLPTFQGLVAGTTSVMSDGSNGSQTGGVYVATVNMDSIAEVRVLMNNYNAEYGRSGGVMINLITKSGGRDYHGSSWLYKRHEEFNANNFFNKNSVSTQFPNGVPKNINRTQSIGGDLGGPVWIPKLLPLSKTRDKLFFFFLFEDTRLKEPVPLERWTMPTALERQGNFSQSFNGTSLITVKDPLTGQAFPGNVIPSNRANQYGLAEENILPLPNFAPPVGSGTYNYLYQENFIPQPRQSSSTRIDYHPTSSDTISFTYKYWSSNMVGIHVAAPASTWGWAYMDYHFGNNQGTVTWTKVINPHLVNELSGGGLHYIESSPLVGPDCTSSGCGQYLPLERQYRGALNSLGQFNNTWNPLNFVPQATWGGVPASYSTASLTFDGREPLSGYDHFLSGKDDLTYSHGAHTFKAGLSYENGRYGQAASSNFAGTVAFDNNSLDPTTTGYAFANAYLGHYYQYAEDIGRGPINARHYIWAAYAQDTWKIRHNLTMDIGVRVYHDPWVLQSDGVASIFAPTRYDKTWGGNPPVIYTPAFNASGLRSAIDPRAPGVFYPQTYIGDIVPGTGNSCTNLSDTNPCHLNGIVIQNDPTYVSGLGFRNYLGPQWDPRLGFAWDPFGDGKTAVRAAFGVFHEVTGVPNNPSSPYARGPAFVYTRTLLSGTLDPSMFSQAALTSPISVTSGVEKTDNKIPSVFQYSFGIQRTLAKGFFASATYVGNTQHYVYEAFNYNVLPFGVQFLPQSLDPTSTATPKAPLAQALLEPIPGYLTLSDSHPAARTRYDSLQTKVNRRFASGLELDFFWTWAKSFGYNSWSQLIPVNNFWGLTSTDQTFVSNVAFVYPLPKGSKLVRSNKLTEGILDNWQLSGNLSFGSGFPQNITLTTSDGYNFTGGGDVNEQVRLTCNPQLGFGNRGFSGFLNSSCVQSPYRNASGQGTQGNFLGSILNGDEYRGPGFNNIDMTLFKMFPMGKEGRETLTVRWEVYNLPNHAEASAVSNTARFSPAGAQQLTTFGTVTATYPERRMQLSLRFNF